MKIVCANQQRCLNYLVNDRNILVITELVINQCSRCGRYQTKAQNSPRTTNLPDGPTGIYDQSYSTVQVQHTPPERSTKSAGAIASNESNNLPNYLCVRSPNRMLPSLILRTSPKFWFSMTTTGRSLYCPKVETATEKIRPRKPSNID
jgi:hypothetical protein